MDRLIAFILCLVLTSQPVLAVNFFCDTIQEEPMTDTWDENTLFEEEVIEDFLTSEESSSEENFLEDSSSEEYMDLSDGESILITAEDPLFPAMEDAASADVFNEADHGTREEAEENTGPENTASEISMDENVQLNSGTCGEDIRWTYDEDGTLSITGSGPMRDYKPSLGGTDIHPWVQVRRAIKNVSISDGITSIGNNAFECCSMLTSITIPESITSIGNGAFLECYSLEEISLPEHLSYLGSSAFYKAGKMKSITLPNSLKEIRGYTFYQTSIKDVSIPKSVTSIGDYAFAYNNNLTSVKLDESLMEIGKNAFMACPNLKSVVIPQSVNSIGDHAFGYQDDSTPYEGFTIYGHPDSAANAYAIANGFIFKESSEGPSKPSPSIEIGATKVTLYAGDVDSLYKSFLLNAKTTNTSMKVKFKSSDKKVAKVSQEGLITALSKGKATITAYFKDGGKTYKKKCKVTVKNPTVKFTTSNPTIYAGSTLLLSVSVNPSAAVFWRSANEAIAKVNSNGLVTGIKNGSTYIYAKANGVEKKLKVTVKPNTLTPTPVSTDKGWKNSYREFVKEKKCLSLGTPKFHTTKELEYALYDMDRNGIPELVISNGSESIIPEKNLSLLMRIERLIILGMWDICSPPFIRQMKRKFLAYSV